MDDGGHREVGRLRFDISREDHSPWNVLNLNQHNQVEQNAFNMNKKILNIIAERDAAIEERNRALVEKENALEEREEAISERNLVIKERNDAILERENALNALQHANFGIQRGRMKRLAYYNPYDSTKMHILNALCQTVVQKNKKQGGITEKQVCSGQLKLKNDWEIQMRVDYDESSMAVPGCSCTGILRHCYKWGNGGWQSSCCTTTMSVYPLPPMPNKRYARMGGRKMSASAFSKLLSRLAVEGYDFSIPVDLKHRWSKHGTNRYITIK